MWTIAMTAPARCATCRHWNPLAPETSDDGECSRVGVSVYLDSKHVVLDGNIIPYGELTLITPKEFGCVRYET